MFDHFVSEDVKLIPMTSDDQEKPTPKNGTGCNSKIKWTTEEEEILKEKCEQKIFLKDISRFLGKSKSACMGKVIRLGLNYTHDRRKIWVNDDIEKLKELCRQNIQFEKIAKILNKTPSSCSQKIYKLGILKPFSNKRYSYNENFWLPNPISCYFAGFSAADASLSFGGKVYEFKICINKRDVCLLHKFKEQSSFTGPVKLRPISIHSGEMCCLSVHSKRWFSDLNKYYNITPRKTFTLQPPNLDDFYLKLCFLIGFIDGDGCIYYSDKGNRAFIKINGASYPMIKWCYDLLYEVIEKFSPLTKTTALMVKEGKYHALSINNKQAAFLIKFLSFFPVPKLERKWTQPKVVEYINWIENKNPEIFTRVNDAKLLIETYNCSKTASADLNAPLSTTPTSDG